MTGRWRHRRPRGRVLVIGSAVLALVAVGVVGTSGGVGDADRWWPGEEAAGSPATARVPEVQAYDRHARQWDARDATETAPASMVWRRLLVDGVSRRYLLSVPAGLRAPGALVLAFHGLGQRAAAFAAQTGLVAASRAAGEVLVLPESEGPAFNDGRLGATGPHDDQFALAILHRLVAQRLVDPERVTVAGFSNGAGMAMQLADAHPEVVAAVVSIDGEMINGSAAPRPTGPVEAVLVHGTADRIQPWNGRRGRGITWPSYLSELATVHAWVDADDAGRVTRSVIRAGTTAHRRGAVELSSWAPGPTGAAVRLYAIDGMGHRWPLISSGHLPTRTDAVEPVSATAIVVDTAETASREGRRTVSI